MNETLAKFLKVVPHGAQVEYRVLAETTCAKHRRLLVSYPSADGDEIPAYLFVPFTAGPHPAVLVHHQHNGERHLGKSEVAGLVGDPLQAFAPVLAERGFVVLAPDSICFEDRRPHGRGTVAHENDWQEHFNELTYRLVRGDTLMRKVLSDASVGLSLLEQRADVLPERIGVLGHSYGGNTALFQAATDDRVKFTCSSGAVGSYAGKMANGTSFEFALTIPGFVEHYDFGGLLAACAPRPFLIVSASEDKYSLDATNVYCLARDTYEKRAAGLQLVHKNFAGGHALTPERRDFIINWLVAVAAIES